MVRMIDPNRHCSLCGQKILSGQPITEHNFMLPHGTLEVQHYDCARERVHQEVSREWRELDARRHGANLHPQ